MDNHINKLNKGAGCGASDLLVAAVILDSNNPITGLNDSKKLRKKTRIIISWNNRKSIRLLYCTY